MTLTVALWCAEICCSVDNVFSARKDGSHELNCNFVVLCGCETWSHSQRQEHEGVREHVAEEGVRPEKEEVKGCLVKLHLTIFMFYTCYQISLAC
jgi:hypothetical protein